MAFGGRSTALKATPYEKVIGEDWRTLRRKLKCAAANLRAMARAEAVRGGSPAQKVRASGLQAANIWIASGKFEIGH
jgi:hypothetical protein